MFNDSSNTHYQKTKKELKKPHDGYRTLSEEEKNKAKIWL